MAVTHRSMGEHADHHHGPLVADARQHARLEMTPRHSFSALALIRSINHRPPGPGGASALNTADNGTHAPLLGISTTSRIPNAPESISAWTRWSGQPPGLCRHDADLCAA